jgi:hypothetical protein
MDDSADFSGGYSISVGLDPSQLAIPGQIGGDMEAASQDQMPGAGSSAMGGGPGAPSANAGWLGSLFSTSGAPPIGPNGLSNPTAPGAVYNGAGSSNGPSFTFLLIVVAAAFLLFRKGK